MQVAPEYGQTCNQSNRCYMVAWFANNASGATWWPNLKQMHPNQMWNIARGTTDPGYWVYGLNNFSDWNQFEIISAEKDYSSFELDTPGPLWLWQCFVNISVLGVSIILWWRINGMDGDGGRGGRWLEVIQLQWMWRTIIKMLRWGGWG